MPDDAPNPSDAPWPDELRLVPGGRILQVTFAGGRPVALPAELLRCESPSAEVQGHSAGERRLVPGKRDVAIVAVEPIGNYAVRLTFDDGHSTGIYGWPFLAAMARDPGGGLARYRETLAAAGLSSDPAPARP